MTNDYNCPMKFDLYITSAYLHIMRQCIIVFLMWIYFHMHKIRSRKPTTDNFFFNSSHNISLDDF